MPETTDHDASDERAKEDIIGNHVEDGRRSEKEEPDAIQAAETITIKTWIVIFVGTVDFTKLLLGSLADMQQILSATFGLSFWPVPTTAAMQGKMAAQLGDAQSVVWFSESTCGSSLAAVLTVVFKFQLTPRRTRLGLSLRARTAISSAGVSV
jgi:hypothetical protein